MSINSYRHYRDLNVNSDFGKYRGVPILQGVVPVILTGKATSDIEPGRIVVASESTIQSNSYISTDLDYLANWTYPAAAVTTNKLLGVALKNEQERWAKPVALTDYTTADNEGDIIKSGELFRILVQGMVYATTSAATVGLESTIFVDYTTNKGVIQIATVSSANTDISTCVRSMAYKTKTVGVGDFHLVPIYCNFLRRI